MIGAWQKLNAFGKWSTGIASGIATLIGAYFAVSGFVVALDGWVVTEAEAAEQLQEQLKVLDEYRLSLRDERRQREIDHAQMELDDVYRQLRYLTNLDNRTPDQDLELTTLQEYQAELRKRLKTLRCIAAGNDPDECSV